MNETEFLVPASAACTETTRFNALKHGILSQYAVLPWEDRGEYETLVNSLAAEHGPHGPTEEHLIEELAGILWRKRRLRLAEAATYRRGLKDTFEPHRKTIKAALVHLNASEPIEGVVEAIRATEADTAEDVRDMLEDEAMTRRALDLLSSRRNDAYEAALATLREDTQSWWADTLNYDPQKLEVDESPPTPDVEGLRRFIEGQVLSWFENRKKELTNRPLIREQAFGESLNPDKLERLGRYEVHLDPKFERTLTILLRLKELRRPVNQG